MGGGEWQGAETTEQAWSEDAQASEQSWQQEATSSEERLAERSTDTWAHFWEASW